MAPTANDTVAAAARSHGATMGKPSGSVSTGGGRGSTVEEVRESGGTFGVMEARSFRLHHLWRGRVRDGSVRVHGEKNVSFVG